jgi:hypothetical protein
VATRNRTADYADFADNVLETSAVTGCEEITFCVKLVSVMSTLAEIEAAVKNLPRRQQKELFAFLAECIGRSPSAEATEKDSFTRVIGLFAGPREATGRKAEEILYGKSV